MRFFKSMTALMLVFSITFAFTACGDAATKTDAATETMTEPAAETPHGEGKAFTAAYVCPMHCADSGSDKPGECPGCGMAYVANSAHTENGHKH